MRKVDLKSVRFNVTWARQIQTVLLLLLYAQGISQDSTYLVQQGVHPTKIIPIADRYQYPKFQSGTFYFYTGQKSEELLLNYNHFAQELQLLDSNGDTVAIDQKASIVEFIQIQSDFYFRDLREGYFLVITKEEPLNLLKRTKWISLTFPNGDTRFQKTYEYYFLGPDKRAHKAERSSLTKLFPRSSREIQNYAKQIMVDFHNEFDLRRMVTFCNNLARDEK